MEFKVGDRVSWLGMKGTVSCVDQARSWNAVTVKMDNGGVNDVFEFYADGRYLEGQRPSLKKLKKKKARYYIVQADGLEKPEGEWVGPGPATLVGHWLKDCGTKKPKGA